MDAIPILQEKSMATVTELSVGEILPSKFSQLIKMF